MTASQVFAAPNQPRIQVEFDERVGVRPLVAGVLPVVEAAGHEHAGRGRVIKPEQHPPVGKQAGPEPGPAAGRRQLQPGRETGVGGQPLQEVPGRLGLRVGRADRVDEGPVAPAPHLAGVEAAVGPD